MQVRRDGVDSAEFFVLEVEHLHADELGEKPLGGVNLTREFGCGLRVSLCDDRSLCLTGRGSAHGLGVQAGRNQDAADEMHGLQFHNRGSFCGWYAPLTRCPN